MEEDKRKRKKKRERKEKKGVLSAVQIPAKSPLPQESLPIQTHWVRVLPVVPAVRPLLPLNSDCLLPDHEGATLPLASKPFHMRCLPPRLSSLLHEVQMPFQCSIRSPRTGTLGSEGLLGLQG